MIKEKIINQLLYSEIFGYPLTEKEIAFAIGEDIITNELDSLVENQIILKSNEFYTVLDVGSKIENRKIGNLRAQELMPKAIKTANFISKFPFVQGVGISGSLSKGVLMHDADFDFFIITNTRRLWIARTLLILYKKIFLLNSRKYFCLNYFIDTDHLQIEEKNIFTATEIATLIPAKGEIFVDFFKENDWVVEHQKIRGFRKIDKSPIQKPFLSKMTENMLKGTLGEWMDKKSMILTFKRWKKKFSSFDKSTFDLTMKTRPYISKHHPQDFQSHVLNRYSALKEQFETEKFELLKVTNVTL